MGSWKIDQATGKTEFCISCAAQCVEVTPATLIQTQIENPEREFSTKNA